MQIQLSDHFTYKKLLRFTISSIVMMIITSMYSVIDGLFVSNLVGDLAFSAVNIVMPVAMMLDAFGFPMGSSFIVSYHYGAGNHEELQNLFRKGIGYHFLSAFAAFTRRYGAASSVFLPVGRRLGGGSGGGGFRLSLSGENADWDSLFYF